MEPAFSRVKVSILDDYFDTLRTLQCFAGWTDTR